MTSYYYICCDNGEEKAKLYDVLSAQGYHFEYTTRDWPWKNANEYHYIPLLADIETKTIKPVPIIGAAAMCSHGKRSYTPDEFLLQMQNKIVEIPHILFHIPHGSIQGIHPGSALEFYLFEQPILSRRKIPKLTAAISRRYRRISGIMPTVTAISWNTGCVDG